jgi:hypothetical protein
MIINRLVSKQYSTVLGSDLRLSFRTQIHVYVKSSDTIDYPYPKGQYLHFWVELNYTDPKTHDW